MTSIVTERLCGSIPMTTRDAVSSMVSSELEPDGVVELGGQRYFELGQTPLEPLPPWRRPGMRRPDESHTEVSSRNESDNPERLDRASSDPGHAVNETRSRCAGVTLCRGWTMAPPPSAVSLIVPFQAEGMRRPRARAESQDDLRKSSCAFPRATASWPSCPTTLHACRQPGSPTPKRSSPSRTRYECDCSASCRGEGRLASWIWPVVLASRRTRSVSICDS